MRETPQYTQDVSVRTKMMLMRVGNPFVILMAEHTENTWIMNVINSTPSNPGFLLLGGQIAEWAGRCDS